MTSNYTETIVPCGACGKELKDEEIRFLWSDVDFLDHDGHWAFIDKADEPTYYARAKALQAARG
jgi:hypothetical protein